MLPQELTFPSGTRAIAVEAPRSADPRAILSALDLDPTSVILIAGGADALDPSLQTTLLDLFAQGIARVATDSGALILDGGTDAGCMALVGQAVAARGRTARLLGIAPRGRVLLPGSPSPPDRKATLEPHHTHFVLVDSDDWGGESEVMDQVARRLAERANAVTVLVNGGKIALDEVVRSVRRGWPIVVLSGTGRLADEVASLVQNRSRPAHIQDPRLAEIVADGTLRVFPANGSPGALERLLLRSLDPALELAWQRFALYDFNARRAQRSFGRVQLTILLMGVLTTMLALAHAQVGLLRQEVRPDWLSGPLANALILAPIATSVLVAAANHFNAGARWVLLRGSAEQVKRQIFRYRVRAASYADRRGMTRAATLVRRLNEINHGLAQTPVNQSALRAYEGPLPPPGAASEGDDGFGILTAEQYRVDRLDDQLAYYRRRTASLDAQRTKLQWLTYLLGGCGTLLAALDFQLWVALPTAIVGALAAYLGVRQVDQTLIQFNQGAANLADVHAWWIGLTPAERASRRAAERLVAATEETLQTESAGWVEQMQEALAKLRAEDDRDEAPKSS